VLAVGDAAFQQKCADVFHGMRESGKTIVLVTHDMGAVETYCDRAMLIHDGDVVLEGSPEDVAKSYYRINFEAAAADPEALAMSQDALAEADAAINAHTKVVEARIEDANGERTNSLEQGEPIRFRAVVEALEELRNPVFSFLCSSRNGTHVFGFRRNLERSGEEVAIVAAGERVELAGTVANPLAPGRYVLTCWISRDAERGEVAFQAIGLADFMVFGGTQPLGLVEVDADVSAATIGSGGEQ
jgi:ABC-type sugar transport system ATPase subunit